MQQSTSTEIHGPLAIVLIIILLFVTVAVFIGIPIFILYKLRQATKGMSNKRFLKGKTVVIQYEAPDGLRPAEVGLLYDNKAGRLEAISTIYDLKARKIVALDDSDVQNVRLSLLRYDRAELADYEDLLLRALFHIGRKINLSQAVRNGEFTILQSYMSFLYMKALQAKGYADFGPNFAAQTYQMYVGAAIAGMVTGESFSQVHYSIFSGIQKSLTQKAKDVMPQLEGFKQFIVTADLDRIRAQMQDKADDFIEQTTPYAVVFNELERWRLLHIPLFTITGGESASATGGLPMDTINVLDSYIVAPEPAQQAVTG